jgi:hypothetical protein
MSQITHSASGPERENRPPPPNSIMAIPTCMPILPCFARMEKVAKLHCVFCISTHAMPSSFAKSLPVKFAIPYLRISSCMKRNETKQIAARRSKQRKHIWETRHLVSRIAHLPMVHQVVPHSTKLGGLHVPRETGVVVLACASIAQGLLVSRVQGAFGVIGIVVVFGGSVVVHVL